MSLVPALMSSIERMEAAKDALMREHQTIAQSFIDAPQQIPTTLRNQMGREQIFQHIIQNQYDCEQSQLSKLKTKSAQTKSLDDFYLLEQKVANFSASVQRMQQEKYDSRLRYNALDKCAILHERMLHVVENLHDPVVLADYLQTASGSSAPICASAGPFSATSIFDETEAGTSIRNDTDDKDAKHEQHELETTLNVQCNGSESTKTQNEVIDVITIDDSSEDEAIRMLPIQKRRESLNYRPLRTQAKSERSSNQSEKRHSRSPHCHRRQRKNESGRYRRRE